MFLTQREEEGLVFAPPVGCMWMHMQATGTAVHVRPVSVRIPEAAPLRTRQGISSILPCLPLAGFLLKDRPAAHGYGTRHGLFFC